MQFVAYFLNVDIVVNSHMVKLFYGQISWRTDV